MILTDNKSVSKAGYSATGRRMGDYVPAGVYH
jgi:hypothetical protein